VILDDVSGEGARIPRLIDAPAPAHVANGDGRHFEAVRLVRLPPVELAALERIPRHHRTCARR
jgi:hypothetical protein